jgi:glutamate-1-semialdehyde 2,1-aminomutase
MEMIAPSGPVYQAGTLSGNPLAMTAGYETLSILNEDKEFYSKLEMKSKRLADGIAKNIAEMGCPLTQNRVGSMSTLFFNPNQVNDYQSALSSDRKRFSLYFREMLQQGIYLAPSQFETGFVLMAHSDADIDKTIEANRVAVQAAFG